jgi:LysR family nitrogen assimilation transcriptional regulator
MKNHPVSLSSLVTFVGVADSGSFYKASVSLKKSHVALRRQISLLEKECSELLFVRTSKGVSLTLHGQRLLPLAKRILENSAALFQDIKSNKKEPSVVRVGFLRSLSKSFGSRIARQVKAAYPDIRLQIYSGSTPVLHEKLAHGELDIAVLFDSGDARRRNVKELAEIRHYLIGPVGNNPTRKKKVKFAELGKLPLILPNKSHGLRTCLDKLAKKNKVELSVSGEVNSLPLARPIIKSGGFYSIIAECAVRWSLKKGDFQASLITNPEIKRSLVLAISPTGEFSPSAGKLLHLMEKLTYEGLSGPPSL